MSFLIYEGVTFVKEACARQSRDEFIKRHIGIYWTDRDKSTRRKMLSEVYSLISPPAKAE